MLKKISLQETLYLKRKLSPGFIIKLIAYDERES